MAQSFTKTAWIEDITAVSAAQLNRMEAGIYMASAPIVTVLPSTPVDGQECNLLADATAGIVWHLVYRSASGKWHYTGGLPMVSGTGRMSTASTGYTTLAGGARIVVPVAGNYRITGGCAPFINTTPQDAYFGYRTSLGDSQLIRAEPNANNQYAGGNLHGPPQATGQLAAAATIDAIFRTSAGTASYDDPWLAIEPITCG
jgi:hypothetical protein